VRLRVTHTTTGRSLVGEPDELLDWLPDWWPGPTDEAVLAQLTQAVYAWEQGELRGWRTEALGVQVEHA
jgi:hypothetical protein